MSGTTPAGAAGPHAASRRSRQLFGLRATARFGWRIALAQFLENAVVIGLLIVLLPGFELHASHEVLAVLWLAAVFGVVSALVRPTLESGGRARTAGPPRASPSARRSAMHSHFRRGAR